jgi:hypothetical protein
VRHARQHEPEEPPEVVVEELIEGGRVPRAQALHKLSVVEVYRHAEAIQLSVS